MINWIVYYLLTGMTLWSLAVMVFKNPGYVPNNHRYNLDKMN